MAASSASIVAALRQAVDASDDETQVVVVRGSPGAGKTRESGRRRIDLEAARRSESRGDVVDYLIARFAELPEQTRRLLGIAACLARLFLARALAGGRGGDPRREPGRARPRQSSARAQVCVG